MSLIAKNKSETKRELIPAGIKTAVCCGIVDLGEQETTWEGRTKVSNRVLFLWEIPKETIETENGPVPRMVSKQFTNSLHEKAALRNMLQAWRGESFPDNPEFDFDMSQMLGQPCMLTVIHKNGKDGTTYAKVDNIMGLPEGLEAPKASRIISFDFDDPDALNTMTLLPEWIQDRIKHSNTYAVLTARDDKPFDKPEFLPAPSDDDAPF